MSNKKNKILRSFYYYDIFLMKNINNKLVKIDRQEESFYEIFEYILHQFTTFHDSYLLKANFTIILENISFSDFMGANFVIGYNI